MRAARARSARCASRRAAPRLSRRECPPPGHLLGTSPATHRQCNRPDADVGRRGGRAGVASDADVPCIALVLTLHAGGDGDQGELDQHPAPMEGVAILVAVKWHERSRAEPSLGYDAATTV